MPNLHKKGVIMGHAQNEIQSFLAKITKADPSTLRYPKLFTLGKYHMF